jgi:hypothetical protein
MILVLIWILPFFVALARRRSGATLVCALLFGWFALPWALFGKSPQREREVEGQMTRAAWRAQNPGQPMPKALRQMGRRGEPRGWVTALIPAKPAPLTEAERASRYLIGGMSASQEQIAATRRK